MNKDIRERAREMFKQRFGQFPAITRGGMKVANVDVSIFNELIDTIITETIKEERDRVVGIIEKQKERAHDDVDYRECCNDSIYLITNKSDINSNK